MKARNVRVGVYEEDGQLRVWSASWTMPGTMPKRRTDLPPREASKQYEIDCKTLERRIAEVVEAALNKVTP